MAITRRTLLKGSALAVAAMLLPISTRSLAAVVSQGRGAARRSVRIERLDLDR